MHIGTEDPPQFKSRPWKYVFDVSEISNFNEGELRDYEANMKYSSDYENTIEYAKKEGLEKGEKKGVLKGILKTAKNMLKDGISPARVARITQLPKEQIMAIR